MTTCTSPSLQVGFRPLLQTLFLQDDLAQLQVRHELPECLGMSGKTGEHRAGCSERSDFSTPSTLARRRRLIPSKAAANYHFKGVVLG
jgi:hypothetical protein